MHAQESTLVRLSAVIAVSMCGVCFSAEGASSRRDDPRSLANPGVRTFVSVPARAPTPEGIAGSSSLAECFNGFVNGPVNGQNAWATLAGSANSPQISSIAPIEGSRSLALPDDPSAANGSLNGALSPTLPPQLPGAYTGTCSILITNTGGADYDFVLQAPSQGEAGVAARVKFRFNDADGDAVPGDILVLNDPDNDGPLPLAFAITTFEYTPGIPGTLAVELDVAGNAQRYYFNGTLIFTGTAYAGTAYEQAVVFSDNFQLASELGKVDCVTIVPGGLCPGDFNHTGAVDVDDLVAVILGWGTPDSSGVVDVDDLVTVILNWGPCV